MALSRWASPAEVKAAYRRLALVLHPDRNPGPAADDLFNYLCEAYRCLSNDESRAAYDDLLARRNSREYRVEIAPAEPDDEPAEPQPPIPPHLRRYPRPGPARFVAVRTARRVPRNRVSVSFERRDPCRRCHGDGLRKNHLDEWAACPTCWGFGHVNARRRLTIIYRTRRVLGGQLLVPHEGDAGDHGGPRGNLLLTVVTPAHTWRGSVLPALVAALVVLVLFFPCLLWLLSTDAR